ncbi:MAG: ankyrin repeat domain-containing protein [Planctomycetes bacterium]|nr:ankyrin repeat domain-containing protein [Planctomycetota bacterium]
MDQEKTHTSAGKWSVALAVIPVTGALLLLLLFHLALANASGCSGLGTLAMGAIIMFFTAHVMVVISLLGIFLGIFAIRKTKWRQGAAGFILNLSVLILVGTFLIDFYYGMSVNPDPDRLRIAAYQGKKRTVEKLLAKGFDINHESNGETALSVVAQGDKQEILEFLLARGADVNIGKPISKAAMWGKVKNVQLLLEHGADPNCLISVVSYGHKEIVKLLLDHGADVNQKDKKGRTPLHVAVTRGVEEIIKLLLGHGADVNAKDDRGETPLHEIVKTHPQFERFDDFRRARVIVMLLDAGADIEAKTKKGKTPLHMATEAIRSQDAIKVLLEHGANPANIEDLNVRFRLAPTSLDKKQLTE